MAITDPEDLQRHLELAIQVELTTIPPYLYAMYSIEDQNSEAALLIRSVVAEEMLHAALVANLLLAVGGRPDFSRRDIIPTYPGFLPHHRPPLRVELAPASPQLARDVFMVIEQPETPGAPPQDDQFETLGQFYYAVQLALHDLAARFDLFGDVQADRQLSDPSFYTPVAYDAEGSGGLMLIDDLSTALEAIEIVIHQGEGVSGERYADPAHQELTHYYKFEQIADGVSPLGAVRPALVNPTTEALPVTLRRVSNLVNALYRYVFLCLDALYQPVADRRPLVDRLYRTMTTMLGPAARYLMEQPVGQGMVAGPTFEVFDFDEGSSPAAQLATLAGEAVLDHPQLAGVAEAVGDLR